MAPPRVRPAPLFKGFVDFARLFFVTLTLALFLVMTGVGVSYFWTLFQNDSYKLVASFLILIAVSNIACKYGLWYWRYYESSNDS